MDGNAAADGIVTQQAREFANERIDVDGLADFITAAEECADTLDNGAGSRAFADDFLGCGRGFLKIGRGGGEPFAAGVRVCDDGGEGLVEFVGNRCSHFCKRESAREAREIVLRANKALLGAALLLNIDVRSVPAGYFTVGGALRKAADEEPAIAIGR